MVRDRAMVTMESVQETTITLWNDMIDDSYDLPFPKMGVPNAPVVICQISNGHIFRTGRPTDFMFGSMLGFSGLADHMALFLVRSNP